MEWNCFCLQPFIHSFVSHLFYSFSIRLWFVSFFIKKNQFHFRIRWKFAIALWYPSCYYLSIYTQTHIHIYGHGSPLSSSVLCVRCPLRKTLSIFEDIYLFIYFSIAVTWNGLNWLLTCTWCGISDCANAAKDE